MNTWARRRDQGIPGPDADKLAAAVQSMAKRKLEEYPQFWNDIAWVSGLHKHFADLAGNALAMGETGDGHAMLCMIALLGWAKAAEERFRELGGFEVLFGLSTDEIQAILGNQYNESKGGNET